jgi:hypothetical protein
MGGNSSPPSAYVDITSNNAGINQGPIDNIPPPNLRPTRARKPTKRLSSARSSNAAQQKTLMLLKGKKALMDDPESSVTLSSFHMSLDPKRKKAPVDGPESSNIELSHEPEPKTEESPCGRARILRRRAFT